ELNLAALASEETPVRVVSGAPDAAAGPAASDGRRARANRRLGRDRPGPAYARRPPPHGPAASPPTQRERKPPRLPRSGHIDCPPRQSFRASVLSTADADSRLNLRLAAALRRAGR